MYKFRMILSEFWKPFLQIKDRQVQLRFKVYIEGGVEAPREQAHSFLSALYSASMMPFLPFLRTLSRILHTHMGAHSEARTL